MHAIRIRPDASDVCVEMSVYIPYHGSMQFTAHFPCGTVWAAALLADQMNTEMRARLSEIRSRAYTMGRGDAKAKRATKTAFSPLWDL